MGVHGVSNDDSGVPRMVPKTMNSVTNMASEMTKAVKSLELNLLLIFPACMLVTAKAHGPVLVLGSGMQVKKPSSAEL